MASHLDKPASKKRQHEESERGQTKRRRVSKVGPQKPPRRSARLNIASVKSFERREPTEPPEPRKVGSIVSRKVGSIVPREHSTLSQPRGQKRPREAEHSSASILPEPSSKRPRASLGIATTSANPETPFDTTETFVNPIGHWIKNSTWPKEYFESDLMDHILVKKQSTPSLRRKRSEQSLGADSVTPSDQKSREEKSAPYRDARYETLLGTKGSYMKKDKKGPQQKSRTLCQQLLNGVQDIPAISRFSDSVFEATCTRLHGRNEAKVIQDITRLIVPSAEELADFGAEHLERLVETVNQGWNNSNPVTKTRPQPDYSVGFEREAFSKEQLKKLDPFIGDFIGGDRSHFMATYFMYFPFMACEVKCGASALDIADRQNAHSMTLAVRGVVELFRLVGREEEVDREILAFSVSHDHRSVRIYGHYAVIEGKDTTYYRHTIHTFDFTVLDGKDKWTAYKFTRNVYDVWMPTHFKRLCSVIDRLPVGVDFDVPPLQQDSGLSQDLQSHHLTESVASVEDDHSQPSLSATTPDTSFTQQSVPKRHRGKASK